MESPDKHAITDFNKQFFLTEIEAPPLWKTKFNNAAHLTVPYVEEDIEEELTVIEDTKVAPTKESGCLDRNMVFDVPFSDLPIEEAIETSYGSTDFLSLTHKTSKLPSAILEESKRRPLNSDRPLNYEHFKEITVVQQSQVVNCESERDYSLDDSLEEGEDEQPEDYIVEHVKVQKLKLIGSGSQAEVYTCLLSTEGVTDPTVYVTKTKRIFDNQEIAASVCKEMLAEFRIAQGIEHPNIIRYHQFLTTCLERNHEINIILEYLPGGNLKDARQ